MTIRNEGLTKAFSAGAAIGAFRLLKFGANDETVIQGAAAGDSIIGVSSLAAATNERVDVILTDIPSVVYGGTITRGQLVISDSTGRAIAATAAGGTNVRTAGVAMVSGVVGDIGAVLLSPGSFQG